MSFPVLLCAQQLIGHQQIQPVTIVVKICACHLLNLLHSIDHCMSMYAQSIRRNACIPFAFDPGIERFGKLRSMYPVMLDQLFQDRMAEYCGGLFLKKQIGNVLKDKVLISEQRRSI